MNSGISDPVEKKQVEPKMVIESITDLGKEALNVPLSYSCFMGISILHKFFSRKRMKYYFPWLNTHFKNTDIILMDDPEAYNMEVFNNLSEEEALRKVRQISDEIKTSYERTLRSQNINSVKVVQFREFKDNPKYQEVLLNVKNYFEINQNFKRSLMELVESGVGGRLIEFANIHKLTPDKIDKVKNRLSRYIIEEFSSLIYFTKNGRSIEIDPTVEFTTKRQLYEDSFPNLYNNLGLTKRGHIFVHPEGVLKNSY